MIAVGKQIKNKRTRDVGVVVGYGMLQWPETNDACGDVLPKGVYLVQVKPASSCLGPACAVWDVGQVEPTTAARVEVLSK